MATARLTTSDATSSFGVALADPDADTGAHNDDNDKAEDASSEIDRRNRCSSSGREAACSVS